MKCSTRRPSEGSSNNLPEKLEYLEHRTSFYIGNKARLAIESMKTKGPRAEAGPGGAGPRTRTAPGVSRGREPRLRHPQGNGRR